MLREKVKRIFVSIIFISLVFSICFLFMGCEFFAAIAIPTYFKYVERGYASDAKVQMKNILENSKLYYSENLRRDCYLHKVILIDWRPQKIIY